MRFSFRRGITCCGCGRNRLPDEMRVYRSGGGICGECFSRFEAISPKTAFGGFGSVDYTLSAYWYNGMFRSIFTDGKFCGNKLALMLIGDLVTEHFGKIIGRDLCDCIVIVPLSKQRMRERGYNQSELLIGGLSRYTDVPIVHALRRIRATAAQSSLDVSEKGANVSGAFEADEIVRGKRVLVFDDIITTGSTVDACAKSLLRAGAVSVGAASAARAKYRDKFTRGSTKIR